MTASHGVTLGKGDTTLAEIAAIADGAQLALAADALAAMDHVQGLIQQAIAQGRVIYGLTTGVGDLVTSRLDAADVAAVQLNMLKSHACGVGAPLAPREVRAMMAVMIKSLLQGYSGVSPALVTVMAQMLNRG